MEKRREARRRTLKGGVIVLPGQMSSTFAVRIRNESSGGVMLVLDNTAPIPREFYLVRDGDPGNFIPCQVRWRSINALGVKFIRELSGQ